MTDDVAQTIKPAGPALPTLKHLRTIADQLRASRPIWDPYGRRPWRLHYNADGHSVRGPLREKTVGYPEGLPGRPYEFATPAQAIAFRDAGIAKLDRKNGAAGAMAKAGADGIRVIDKGAICCGYITRYRLSNGMFIDRAETPAHRCYGEKYGVYLPGAGEAGTAACFGGAKTLKDALALAAKAQAARSGHVNAA